MQAISWYTPLRKDCGHELSKSCKCEDNPLEGSGVATRMEELIGITGQPTPARVPNPGQPPAKIAASPGKSGSSEVFRTTTGQMQPSPDGTKGYIEETPEMVKWVKFEGDTVIECEATDEYWKFRWSKSRLA